MSDEKNTDQERDGAAEIGHTNIPEESPASDSEVALSTQAARRDAEKEQDDQ